MLEITAIPIKTPDKNLVIEIAHDISEKKQLEKKVEEDEKRYHALFDHAPAGILIIDPQTAELVEFNDLAYKQLGYSRAEFGKLKVYDYKANRNRSEIDTRINSIIKQGIAEFNDKHLTKNGEVRDVAITSQAIEFSGKTFIHSVYRDITESKKIELALMESENMYRSLVEHAQEGVWALDCNNCTVYVNPKITKLLGYSEGDILGKFFGEFLEKMNSVNLEQMWEDLKRGSQIEREFVFVRRDGRRMYALVSVSSILDDDGSFNGSLALVTDITLRRLMEQKLQDYSSNLEEIVKQRTSELLEAQAKLIKAERLAAIGQVAAMVGHDLRNPLTGINSALFYLKRKLTANAEPTTLAMLDVIEKDVKYANTIITDLMDYSREIQLDLNEATPSQVIAESIALVTVPENVHVLNSTQSTPILRLDVEKIKRVFANFIKNAVEAMPNGGELAVSSKELGREVEFKVADKGTGMSKEVLEKIWTPFFTTKARGMGLGLPICKRVIDAHQGKVSVESIVGQGTTFTITLPMATA